MEHELPIKKFDEKRCLPLSLALRVNGKFWRIKWLPSERGNQSSPTTAKKNEDDEMLELKNEISAINKVIEAARLRRKEGETENQAESSKVTFYLDPDPERYDLDWYLATPKLPVVYDNDNDDDEDDEEESDVDDDEDYERRCVLF
ncbi:hypothetical protein ACTXT7_006086 [Hymenolepis weldensis]